MTGDPNARLFGWKDNWKETGVMAMSGGVFEALEAYFERN